MSVLSKFLLTGTLMGAISLPFILPHLSKTPPASCGCYAEAAISSTPPATSPTTCGVCTPNGCQLDPGETARLNPNASPFYAWKCIDWDGIPPGHCAWTQREEYDVMITFNNNPPQATGANCFRWLCSGGTPRNDAPCPHNYNIPTGTVGGSAGGSQIPL